MKIARIFLALSIVSLVASCTPEALDTNNPIDGPHSTNDNSATVDNGSKK